MGQAGLRWPQNSWEGSLMRGFSGGALPLSSARHAEADEAEGAEQTAGPAGGKSCCRPARQGPDEVREILRHARSNPWMSEQHPRPV